MEAPTPGVSPVLGRAGWENFLEKKIKKWQQKNTSLQKKKGFPFSHLWCKEHKDRDSSVFLFPALCCVVCAGSFFCFPVFLKEAMEEQAPPDVFDFSSTRCEILGPATLVQVAGVEKYLEYMMDSTLVIERGFKLGLT